MTTPAQPSPAKPAQAATAPKSKSSFSRLRDGLNNLKGGQKAAIVAGLALAGVGTYALSSDSKPEMPPPVVAQQATRTDTALTSLFKHTTRVDTTAVASIDSTTIASVGNPARDSTKTLANIVTDSTRRDSTRTVAPAGSQAITKAGPIATPTQAYSQTLKTGAQAPQGFVGLTVTPVDTAAKIRADSTRADSVHKAYVADSLAKIAAADSALKAARADSVLKAVQADSIALVQKKDSVYQAHLQAIAPKRDSALTALLGKIDSAYNAKIDSIVTADDLSRAVSADSAVHSVFPAAKAKKTFNMSTVYTGKQCMTTDVTADSTYKTTGKETPWAIACGMLPKGATIAQIDSKLRQLQRDFPQVFTNDTVLVNAEGKLIAGKDGLYDRVNAGFTFAQPTVAAVTPAAQQGDTITAVVVPQTDSVARPLSFAPTGISRSYLLLNREGPLFFVPKNAPIGLPYDTAGNRILLPFNKIYRK